MKPYCTTSQVLNQAIKQLAVQAVWNVSEPGTVVIQDLTYTALAVSSGGIVVSVAYTPGAHAGAEVVSVNGAAITVQIEDGVSTAAQILAALQASAAAMALIYAAVSGTGSNPQDVTAAPEQIVGDIVLRIIEAGNEIDTRLAGLGVPLPFATNPPALQDWAVLWARYACLRDLYTGTNPQANSESAKVFKDAFEEKFKQMQDGWQALLDQNGAVVAANKYTTITGEYPAAESTSGDKYPNFPLGPYPDLPGVDSY